MAKTDNSPEATVLTLSLPSIVHRCSVETQRFFNRLSHDNRFCYELFRRAIEFQDQLAWRHVYTIFSPLVTGWVLRHPSFKDLDEEASYFVNRALERLWSAVPAEKFKQYGTLEALLRYLQMCVHSVIVDYVRKIKLATLPIYEAVQETVAESGESLEDRIFSNIERSEFWLEISQYLKNDHEKIVIYNGFVLGLKSREILEKHPQSFDNVQEIYRVRKNVLARLKRNLEIEKI